MDKSCTCKKCIGCCQSNPGWFMPGEAEKAAKFLEMDFKEFKSKYLIIDYWGSSTCDIDVLAPRKVDIDRDKDRTSFSYAFFPSPCIFLKSNRCMIHEAKPYECRKAFGCGKDSPLFREDIAKKWRDLQVDKFRIQQGE